MTLWKSCNLPNQNAMLAVVVSLCLLTACQKKPEASAEADVVAPVATTVATEENGVAKPNDKASEKSASDQTSSDTTKPSDQKQIAQDTVLENEDDTVAEAPPSLAGAQVTDVHYKSDDGSTMSVVFETSRDGILNAIVSFPNQPKITLTAPEGQGNNPTYRSKDGKLELVSHEGGSSIDLIDEGDIKSFVALSADAAVVTQS